MRKANWRLLAAMICYSVLILVALYALLPVRTSNEAFVLAVLLLFFALLIIKTLAHSEDQD
jgi:hypothetical protein